MLPARRRVVVTGVGMVSPLGHCVATSWARLKQGETGMVPIDEAPCFFPKFLEKDKAKQAAILDALPAKVVAPVKAADPACGSTETFGFSSRSTRHQSFAERAASEALMQSGLLRGRDKGSIAAFNEIADKFYPAHRRGVNVGVGMNSLHDIAEACNSVYANPSPKLNRVEPFFVPKILCNTIAGSLSTTYSLQGPNHSTSTACATGAHCIGDGVKWIQYGDADMAIVGAAEAAINPIGIAGFARMKALSTKFNDEPSRASRPFDEDRCGFVMGEGAGVLVLEEMETALARGANILCEMVGFGMSGDAYHVSSPHPCGIGAGLAMRNALTNSQRSPDTFTTADDVCHVSAHATSTPLGDEIELTAITRELRGGGGDAAPATASDRPPVIVSSVKGSIGHLLGAAGAVEAIFAIMSMAERVAPLTANLETPAPHDASRVHLARRETASGGADGEFVVPLTPTGGNKNQLTVMSTSFGFGGTNGALLLRKQL